MEGPGEGPGGPKGEAARAGWHSWQGVTVTHKKRGKSFGSGEGWRQEVKTGLF